MKKEKEEKEKQPFSLKSEVISWIQIIVTAAIIAFVLNTFIIANSEVPSGSMENTIMTGSRVIGSRLNYRFADPKHGDIAIFVYGWECPECGDTIEGVRQEICPACGAAVNKRGSTVHYVKRVIGTPGDVIDIVDDAVYRNGELLEEPYLAEPMNQHENFHFEVPANSYFMMGDNRNYSLDARYWQEHYITKDRITAKVLFEYFPKIKWIR